MSTHKITIETNVPFPCWLWRVQLNYIPVRHRWHLYTAKPDWDWRSEHTHYSTNPPDQPPTERPTLGGDEHGSVSTGDDKPPVSSDPTPAAPSVPGSYPDGIYGEAQPDAPSAPSLYDRLIPVLKECVVVDERSVLDLVVGYEAKIREAVLGSPPPSLQSVAEGAARELQSAVCKERGPVGVDITVAILTRHFAPERDERIGRLEREVRHWKNQTLKWNEFAVDLGKAAGVSDSAVPWYDTAHAAVTALRTRLRELEQAIQPLVMAAKEKPTADGIVYPAITTAEISAAIRAARKEGSA